MVGWPRRRLVATLVALALAVVVVAPASAGRTWCRRDPGFRVAGTTVNVWVGVPEADQARVTGPLKVILYVPVGTHAVVEFTDDGFNGHGEEVIIIPAKQLKHQKNGVRVQAEVTVPAATNDVPVTVSVVPASGRAQTGFGKSNQVVSIFSSVDPSS